MRNPLAVKENQARSRLLRFTLLTLGGMALEGSLPPAMDKQKESKKTGRSNDRPLG